jgi:hypothetical protein
LSAAFDAELAEDRGNVVVDGLLGEKELSRNLTVTEALTEERQNFELPSGQPGWVFAGRGSRPEAHAADATLAQYPRNTRARPWCAEPLELGHATTQRVFIVGRRKRESGLVGAAD